MSKPLASQPKISIILPTFNEAGSIEKMIFSVAEQFDNDHEYEILVVDDSSTDGTIEIVNSIKPKLSNLKLIVRTSDFGLINSINEGITQSTGEISLWMDADLSMDPALIPVLVDKIESGFDLALGSRYIPGGSMKGGDPDKGKSHLINVLIHLAQSNDSMLSAIISIVGNKILGLILGSAIKDYSSGFFAARKTFIEKNPPYGTFVDYCISLPYKAVVDGYKVTEVPMVLKARETGKSKTSSSYFSIFSISLRCVSYAVQLRLKHGKI